MFNKIIYINRWTTKIKINSLEFPHFFFVFVLVLEIYLVIIIILWAARERAVVFFKRIDVCSFSFWMEVEVSMDVFICLDECNTKKC